MMKDKAITAATMGGIAKQYNLSLYLFRQWLEVHPELKKEIDTYTADAVLKASKVLPPIVVLKIFTTLGMPE